MSSRPLLCAICSQQAAIYTCPRCATRSCSVACAKSHKELASCSGERDKTGFVPMNKYGWGTMANDYTFLEEVGRKSAEWGVDIIKSGLLADAAAASSYCGRGIGRGGRGGRGGPKLRAARGGGAKREFLKRQLEARDIDIDLLPLGMEKRRLNQSIWDNKLKSPLLTVELVFHPPTHSAAAIASSDTPCYSALTHRNALHMTIQAIIIQHLLMGRKKNTLPSWLTSLLPSSSLDDKLDQFDYYIMVQPGSQGASPPGLVSKVFQKLDAGSSLSDTLRHKSFIEYPTIEVWGEGEFRGPVIDVDGRYLAAEEEATTTRPVATKDKQVIATLLGGYNSHEEDDNDDDNEEDEEEKEEREDEQNVLATLGGYGTDDEESKNTRTEAPMEEDHFDEDSSEENAEDFENATMEDIRDIFDAIGDTLIQQDDTVEPVDEDSDYDWGDSDSGNEGEKLIHNTST